MALLSYLLLLNYDLLRRHFYTMIKGPVLYLPGAVQYSSVETAAAVSFGARAATGGLLAEREFQFPFLVLSSSYRVTI